MIRKIAYFQLQPESQGGTVSYSKTKGTWIEEYANATHARQVLNGSINAWIGLYEYCKFFPNDVAAARIRDEMYDTILHSLEIYCLPTWCRYNQSGQQCTPSYLRYHIYEMLHLYEIKGETKFLRQMMLWAMVLSPRKIDNKDHVFLRDNHTIARPAPANASDWHVSKYDLVPELIKAGKSATSTNFGSKKELKNYILKKKSPAKVSASSKQNMFLMEFSGPINLDYITVDFESEKDIEPDFALFSVNSKTGEMKKLSFESNPLGYNSWHARILDKPTGNGFDNLLLVAKGSNVGSMQNTKVGLYNTDGFEMPWFGFYHTNPLSLTKDVKYCITVPKMHTGDVKIFWRYGPNEKQASAGTFLPNNYIQGNNFTPTKPGYYQFAIIFEVESVLSSVGMLIYEAH
ncbi:MAG TPA: hypothetical protein ENJ82_01405 [Bacteroidetes bacterium]|nr:hypothetical protein [Bacteroidota bacterium]